MALQGILPKCYLKKNNPTSLWHGETRRRPPDLFNAKCKAKNFLKVYRFKNTWSGIPPCSLSPLCRRHGCNSVVFCRGCSVLTQQVSMLCILSLQTVKQPQNVSSGVYEGKRWGIDGDSAVDRGGSDESCKCRCVCVCQRSRTLPLPSNPLTNLKTS